MVALFLGGFGVWGALAPLSSGAVASGVIGVSSERKTVNHLEGGIVEEIRVTDGDVVAAGQILIVLDDTRPRAALDLLEAQWRSAATLNARLEAERDGLSAIYWPGPLQLAAASRPETAEVLVTQERLFEARAVSLANQIAIYERRVEQLREREAGLREELASQERQISLLDEGLFDIRRTVLLGLESKHQRLLDLQRDRESAAGGPARAPRRSSRASGWLSWRRSCRSTSSATAGSKRWRRLCARWRRSSRTCASRWRRPATWWRAPA